MRWLIPQRVLFQKYTGDVTAEDLQHLGDILPQYVDEATPLMHTLIDVSQARSSLNMKGIMSAMPKTVYDKEGWRVLVGLDRMGRFIGSVILQMIGQRYRLFDNMDEALAFLADQDKTLELLTRIEL